MPTVDTVVDMDDFQDCYFTGPRYVGGKIHADVLAPDLSVGGPQAGLDAAGSDHERGISPCIEVKRAMPHLVDYRCAHRGVPLTVGWVEGECIRCRFHGWKYDGTGQCVEQPAEDESFAAKGSSFGAFRPRNIWASSSRISAKTRRRSFLAIRNSRTRDIWIETYIRPCNFLNNIENDPDSYSLHPSRVGVFYQPAGGDPVGEHRRNRVRNPAALGF